MSLHFRIIATGDSTTASGSPLSYFYTALQGGVLTTAFGGETPRYNCKWFPAPNVACLNLASPGYKLANLDTQAAQLDAMVNLTPPTGGGRPTIYNILACRIGTNHDESDAAVYAALVRTHYLARQAAGWLVIDLPMWSKTGGGQDAFAQAYNAIKATWTTSDGVAAVVPATEPLLYGTNAYANTTYFNGDGIHPTTAGHNLAARDFLVTLDALMVSLGALAMPTGLVATAGTAEVTLDWDRPSGSTNLEWNVYRSTTDSFAGSTLLSAVGVATNQNPPQPTPTYTDSTAATGTVYYFWVTRYNPITGEETLPTLSVTATPS